MPRTTRIKIYPPFLNECIESLLDQGLGKGELQIVCVDDGSTDGSSELLDELAAQHDELCVSHQGNMGVGAARNAALGLVRGEFIAFVDADDVVAPNAYGVICEKLRGGYGQRFDFLLAQSRRRACSDGF